ncbi:uncharacterized protein LOC122395259 [Colletes gigas]|uniref:uncharacterized protein LOC122395259 n=1 Tax=Colletes gigas TaxID=935657 RepID=UPI001C9AD6C5|nr:uncharacterized protein LOC122395259 [Colletes gigas]
MENERSVHVIGCPLPPYSEAVTAPPMRNETGPPIGVHYQGYNQPMAPSYPQSWIPVGINVQQPNSFTPQYNPPANYIVRSENIIYENDSCVDTCCVWCLSIVIIIILAVIIRVVILAVLAR